MYLLLNVNSLENVGQHFKVKYLYIFWKGPTLVNKLILDQDIKIWIPYFWARNEFGCK